MLRQAWMIERLRQLCREDERVVAAMLYGSFTTGEGDSFSDIECALFFQPDALSHLDKRQWVQQLAPVLLFFQDGFGHYTAIFEDLIRGEFHFEPAEKIATIASWHGNAWFPKLEAAILVDRTGELRKSMQPLVGLPPARDTPENAEQLICNFVNLVLFGVSTLERGERARALEILSLCQRYGLWMARLEASSTLHWPTPSRWLEHDLSPAMYQRFVQCTAHLDRSALMSAYRSIWTWGAEMAHQLIQRHRLTLPEPLFALIADRIAHLRE